MLTVNLQHGIIRNHQQHGMISKTLKQYFLTDSNITIPTMSCSAYTASPWDRDTVFNCLVLNLVSGTQNISQQTIVVLCKDRFNQDIKPFVAGKDPNTIKELREAIYLATSVRDCKASDVNTNNTNISTQNAQNLNVEKL